MIFFDIKRDWQDTIADGHYGTLPQDREHRWEMYMKQHGLDVDVKNVNVTIDNYNTISADGYVIIEVDDLYIKDNNGIYYPPARGGKHCMTVTGVTDDGLFVVSSWGDKWYLDPDDYKNFLGGHSYRFQKITYS